MGQKVKKIKKIKISLAVEVPTVITTIYVQRYKSTTSTAGYTATAFKVKHDSFPPI